MPLRHSKSPKTILLLEYDLFSSVGGGQTSYRRLIESCPQNTYYYFIVDEPVDAARLPNAVAIPFVKEYYANTGDMPVEMEHFYYDYLECWHLAASVFKALGACSFDVVDCPDYKAYALFIRGALAMHSIRADVVALALHGTISSALRDQWPKASATPRLLAQLRLREHLQYRAVDVRYALSEAYAQEWERIAPLAARPIDPVRIVGAFDPQMATADAGEVDLCFVGRRERRKGPDVMLDIAWAQEAGTFGKVRFIGSDAPSQTGIGSAAILENMARIRGLPIEVTPKMSRAELDTLFRGRNVVILPSRYDQFNLVALEALRLGCPVFVSRSAGVATWIESRYPELSDLVIDIDCSRTGAEAVRAALRDYDGLRRRIVDAISAKPPVVGDDDLADMFEPLAGADEAARGSIQDIQVRFDSFNRPRKLEDLRSRSLLRQAVALALPASAKKRIRWTAGQVRRLRHLQPRTTIKVALKHGFVDYSVGKKWMHESAPRQIANMRHISGTRQRLLSQGERTSVEVAKKLESVSGELGSMRVGRVPIFRDMARLERKRGNDLIAATYCLRIMRWLDRDEYGDLGFVVRTLKENGYDAEAGAADAMYGDPARAAARCRALLDQQYERHLAKPDLPFEILDDRRGDAQPTVSVISSLYNAESKLHTLLDNMRIQSLAKAGKIEVVLVDSGSPTREYEAFKAFCERSDLPIVYARSKDRESIQKAWNRGIKLARAPYLCFLGVDEGLHPDCLSVLSGKLDDHADVDWVMADSIVTDVDRKGVFVGDVMPYDRRGYSWGHVFLDTTYLSWVGGLYRKSIHDRFGYYDETFKAAGDTEFKGRLLSRIKTMHVPLPLGVFNNYPEERTTQSPRAELEDLRAWYLHRTPAGVAYSFDRHPVGLAEELFRHTLTYRKAFCGHWSSDLDLAGSIASYLRTRGENPDFADKAVASSARVLSAARDFDFFDLRVRSRKRQWQAFRRLAALRQHESEDQSTFGLPMRPHYEIFNDNRHEQHWWSWSV